MSSTSIGFLEFALKAWNNRHTIMQAENDEARTRRIYDYYNYFEGLQTPDLSELLKQVEIQLAECGNYSFYFQNYFEIKMKGDDISKMAKSLNDTIDNDSSMIPLLKTMFKESYAFSYYDSDTRTVRAPKTKKELIASDPAFVLDQFLWNFTNRRGATSLYRIYVTPRAVYAPRVFKYLIHNMNRQAKLPSSGKLILPGPLSDKRVDKIVLYCQNEEEMKGGIELLEYYQITAGRAHYFENQSPLSTKPVDGLTGVAVTSQPTPDAVIMHYAGIERVKGISFGMSRAAIIYLALRDNYRKQGDASISFLDDCHRIARLAGIDIEQNQGALQQF